MFPHLLESDISALSFTIWYELTHYNSSEAKSWKGNELYPMLITFHHSIDWNTIHQICHSVIVISFQLPKSFVIVLSSLFSVCLCTVQYLCVYDAAHLRLGIGASSIEAYQLPYRNTHTMITHALAPNPKHSINTLHLFDYTEPTKTPRSAVSLLIVI